MNKYIEREALRDALYDADAITMEGVKILNQFPAADVEPVRHGHFHILTLQVCRDALIVARRWITRWGK